MTTDCDHRFRPWWRIDADGLGSMRCPGCDAALTPEPEPADGYLVAAVFVLAALLLLALLWWVWLS